MTLLQLLAEGAIAAAELIAMTIVPPALAVEPARLAAGSHLEQPVALHRLSTTVDVRLLGSLADVRVAQHLRNEGAATADLGPRLPAVDESVDALRVVRGSRVVELLPVADCGDATGEGHAQLSDDEAIADALQLAPGQDAIVETMASAPLVRGPGGYRVALPLAMEADEPRAVVVDQDDAQFLLVVPHRAARAATLVIRAVTGESEWLRLGAVDPREAVLIPLKDRARLTDVAQGALELELADGAWTYWTTLVAERVDARGDTSASIAE